MGLSKTQREWLTLALVPGVGTARFIRLIARFHTPGEVLGASIQELGEIVGEELAIRIHQYKDIADISAQEKAMDKIGAHCVTMDEPLYPTRLAEIYDPPLFLFYRGYLYDSDEKCIAIVGTRHPTPYGLRVAEQFARELACRGFTIVSGLANGIDAAAHRGALNAGGRTIAVLGNGVDIAFPPENKMLMDAIINQGCVLSQYPIGTKPRAEFFPYRNRVISGLSLGTLVIEAPLRSGALITAKHAAEQGREVFAVPGPITNGNSQGPHRLIQEGAKLVQNVEDILVELEHISTPLEKKPILTDSLDALHSDTTRGSNDKNPIQSTQNSTFSSKSLEPSLTLSEKEKAILASLTPEGSFVDEIAMACQMSISEALSSLTLLELKGLVSQYSGKRFAPR